MIRNTARLLSLTAGLMAGAVVLTGCSDNSDSSSAATSAGASSSINEAAAHNSADVTFVQEMIPHHQGALAMAQMADGRAEDPRVLDLAARIEAAQEPEIESMTGWLEEWGEPLPEGMGDTSDDMDHGSGGMDMGSMSEGDMAGLDSASGAQFDRMFLQMMIPHHQGAVDMAETEIGDGSNADAVQLARDIVASQTAEIAEMEMLLAELGE